jgi:hypothetical protein
MLIVNNKELLDVIKPRYTVQDIQEISGFLQGKGTFLFPALENGLFPAAIVGNGTEYTGYANVWVRDNIYVAYAHWILGKVDLAGKNVNSLMAYFKKHRRRFEEIIEFKVDPQNPLNRPHIRFNGQDLEEIDQKWPHAQNDALGYFLWFYCELATQDILQPQPEDMSMLASFAFYFQAIRYWEDEDSGHWEETRKIGASSIGVVTAGLKALRQLVMKTPLASYCKYKDKSVTVHGLDELIEKGMTALEGILPAECIQTDPAKRRRYDAALLFLIYPLRVVGEEMAHQILQDVINHLQGDYGIRRYLGDSYWAPDYKKKLPPEERTVDFSEDISSRDSLLPKRGEEAQWCIFDPIISIIFGDKFQSTREGEYLDQQVKYLNRSLGQITGKDDGFSEFRCPELYYLADGQYVPNDNVPLLWTQANLSIALKVMERSVSQRGPKGNGWP